MRYWQVGPTAHTHMTLGYGSNESRLEFVQGTARDGSPWADDVRLIGDGASDLLHLLLGRLPGWTVSLRDDGAVAPDIPGAVPLRHAHHYLWHLSSCPPDPDWARPKLPPRVHFVPALEVDIDQLQTVRERAYLPGHPDRSVDRSRHLVPLLTGALYGRNLACSTVALLGPQPIGAILANAEVGPPALPGPGFTDLFRDPECSLRGIGSLLMKYALATAYLDGLAEDLRLAVTEGNPARRLYERLGFRHVYSTRTLRLPGDSQSQ
ncbi:GNAT family N-acetyltransferase [Streptomyces sp. HUAS TT20]|uniref:GNAT family N-acetyltransferase n=1 Tax=Streptomyces sp. HUAS TT20 TaxID=3447509 RepID=UPI00398797CD